MSNGRENSPATASILNEDFCNIKETGYIGKPWALFT